MSSTIVHGITFYQKRSDEERSVVLQLTEGFQMFAVSQGHGTWSQKINGDANPFNIKLCPNFTQEDKQRMFWRWIPDQHGGLITVGLTAKGASHSGNDTFEKVMFTFRAARRYVTRRFEVASGKMEGEAFYEFGGSSDTFDKGAGTWMIMRYN